jgi:PPOX class probable F420-dependent enzyme
MLNSYPEVVELLNDELVGWLTTVTPEGQPQAQPVWHVIDGQDLVVFNRPTARRLRNIGSNPRISYNLRGDPQGDLIVSMEGTAALDASLGSPIANPSYIAKYSEEMIRLGWSPAEYDAEFSTPLRITLTRVRADLP